MCGQCAAAAARAAANRRPAAPKKASVEEINALNADCPFTNTILQNYQTKIVRFRDKGKYLSLGITAAIINRYIGVLKTSINIDQKCTYKDILYQIQDLVNTIIAQDAG